MEERVGKSRYEENETEALRSLENFRSLEEKLIADTQDAARLKTERAAKVTAFFKNTFEWLSTSKIFTSTYELYDLEQSISDVPDWHDLKKYLIRAFGLDGYDDSTHELVSADGKTSYISRYYISFGFILLSFFGIPNRPESIKNHVPTFSFWQFWRGLIGGWNPVKETITGTALDEDGYPIKVIDKKDGNVRDKEASFSQRRWTEKKTFFGLVLTFKILVIAPFKLVTIPFKIMLNVVKLVTEVLLPLVSDYTALLNVHMIYASQWLAEALVNYRVEPLRLFFLIPLIPMAALTLVVGIVQYAMLWACRIGLALTSPNKSARLAYEAGIWAADKFFVVDEEGKERGKLQKTLPYIMGGLGYILSMTLSAVLWTITLPLAWGALVTVFPAILTAITWVAQLPWVASSLAWLSQLPVVAGSTTLIDSFIKTVGGALSLAFGPAVNALALVIGVKVSTTVMMVGTTLGLIATPVVTLLSHGADVLSNLFAKWVEQAPIASLKAFLFRKRVKGDSAQNTVELSKIPSKDESAGQYVKIDGADKNSSNPEDLLEKETSKKKSSVQKDEAYVYYPLGGVYVIGEKPLYLVHEKKRVESEFLQYLPGIKVKGEQAEALWDRANNVELKGLLTQGVATPKAFVEKFDERAGTREFPYVVGN